MEDLRYVCDSGPGFRRRKHGRGFVYQDEEGNKITCKETLSRIKKLVIPPMWQNVWICKYQNGHLQATGYDEKKRKQYLYHDLWTKYRNEQKFSRMVEFAEALPMIRKKCDQDLQKDDWPKEKILALALKILDEAYIRIGNESYLKENQTYGLTTLRRKHLKAKKNKLILEYKAKSGKYRKISLKNKKLNKLITKCAELPGYEIFRYKENGKFKSLDSQDVNCYLRDISGDYFTAKNFRTWGGTVLALKYFPTALKEVQENSRKKLTTTVVKKVAKKLGNTQKICRDYYIHPALMTTIENEDEILFRPIETRNRKYGLGGIEERVLEIIRA